MSNAQRRVPFGLSKGDRVQFKLTRHDDEWRDGMILDILSEQFIIVEDDNLTHITHFDNACPAGRRKP